mgnify:CR=1 FL=1
MIYYQESVFSGKGAEPHQFSTSLCGIALDSVDRVYAVGDADLKVFDRKGTLQRRWPTESPGFSVAISDSAQEIYVGQAGQLTIYDRTGHHSRPGETLRSLVSSRRSASSMILS